MTSGCGGPFLSRAEGDDLSQTPPIGYASCTTTDAFRERIMSLMKKPVAAVLDWLWDRLTYLVMSQGR